MNSSLSHIWWNNLVVNGLFEFWLWQWEALRHNASSHAASSVWTGLYESICWRNSTTLGGKSDSRLKADRFSLRQIVILQFMSAFDQLWTMWQLARSPDCYHHPSHQRAARFSVLQGSGQHQLCTQLESDIGLMIWQLLVFNVYYHL